MFFSHKKKDIVLIVDVGSGSVGAAVVELIRNHAPKILCSNRLPIVLSVFQDNKNLQFATADALDHVIKQLKKHPAFFSKINRSHIIFSAPWYRSETTILKIKHKSPVTLTEKVFEDLIKNEEERFSAEVHFDDYEVVERRLIQTKINGYDTPSPFGKSSKDTDMTFFVGLVSKDILNRVKQVVGSHFQHEKMDISSFSVASFTAIRALSNNVKDFLIVDVRGEVTDILVARDENIQANISFPYGRNGLVRAFAEGTKESVHTALSSLVIALHGHIRPSLRTILNKAIEPWKNVWLKSYDEAITTIMSGASAPKTIFLMGDSETEMFFEKIIVDMFHGVIIHPLKKADLHKYVSMTSTFHDPFLALEAIFINQLSK